MKRNRPLVMLTLCLFALACLAAGSVGCTSDGSHGWSESANPCTKFEIDPLNKKLKFYSNDGRAMTADKIVFKKTADGTYDFEADAMNITERSVENRQANVDQVAAMGILMERVAKANWEGISNALRSSVGLGAALGFTSAGGDDPSKLLKAMELLNALNAKMEELQGPAETPAPPPAGG